MRDEAANSGGGAGSHEGGVRSERRQCVVVWWLLCVGNGAMENGAVMSEVRWSSDPCPVCGVVVNACTCVPTFQGVPVPLEVDEFYRSPELAELSLLMERRWKCMDGEHDADRAFPLIPPHMQTGQICWQSVCRHCRSVFVPR